MEQTSKSTTPIVSIIVPVYNEASLLHRCLDSILHQTYTNLDIIIVDDGSTDDSLEICEQYKRSDKRVTVIHETNAGLSAARNNGVESAKGEFIAFVDSDDYLDVDFIERLVNEATTSPDIDLVITDFQTDIPGWKSPRSEGRKECSGIESIILAEHSAYHLTYVVPWNKLYRARLFSHVAFPVGKIHEDEFTYYLFLYYSQRVSWINCPGYHYLYNADGITGQQGSSPSIDKLEALTEKSVFYLQNPNLEKTAAPAAINELSWYFFLMGKDNWRPSTRKQQDQYTYILTQINQHKSEMLAALGPLKAMLFNASLHNPKIASTIYFTLHNIKSSTQTDSGLIR